MYENVPWHETDRFTEQMRFIERWSEGRESVAALCRRFGISRKTGHKRIRRFLEEGIEGVGDLSRRPRTIPHKTPRETSELLIDARTKHPAWGPRKLVAYLGRLHPGLQMPAPSTAGEILRRAGLVKQRRRRRGSSGWAGGMRDADEPGVVWCADFKGWFKTSDGARCDPFTLSDQASRYILTARCIGRPWTSPV